MLVKVLPRRTGRTTWAVDSLHNNPHHYLLTFNAPEAERIINDHPELRGRVLPWDKAASRLRGTNNPLVIDNLDLIIQGMFPNKIEAVTIEGFII